MASSKCCELNKVKTPGWFRDKSSDQRDPSSTMWIRLEEEVGKVEL